MNKFNSLKKIISLILVLCFSFSLVSCDKSSEDKDKNTDKETPQGESVEARIPYSREDGVNPYFAKSLMNSSVMPLMYDGLFYVDESYKPVPNLASDYEVVDNTLVVNLSSKRFSDAGAVMADDVVYSFNKAKASPYYASELTNIITAYAKGSKTVVFELPFKNIYSAAALTFPIVKVNSAEDIKSIPIGSGRYVYKETSDGGLLKQNIRNTSEEYDTESITLINMTTSTALLYGLVVNNYDATFDDLSSGKTQRINASAISVPLNNMVYLGINTGGSLADPVLRKNLSIIIDRKELVNSGLEGNGHVAYFPANPSWYGLKGLKTANKKTEEAAKYASDALKGKTLNILANADNPFKVKIAETLVKQLGSEDIAAAVISLPRDEYIAAASGRGYDLCVTEFMLTNDMNISPLISDEALLNAYAEMMAGNMKYKDFINLFNENPPFIPIGFRQGILAYSRNINSEIKPLPQNPYANIFEWVV